MGRQGRILAGIALLLLALMGVALWLVLGGGGGGGLPAEPGVKVSEPGSAPGDGGAGPESATPERPMRPAAARGSGKLSGEVRLSEDRRPVGGQRVVLIAPDGSRREAVTDDGGRFEFEDVVRDARHKLVVEATGFGTVRRAGVRLGRHRRLDLGTLWIAPSANVVVEVWGSHGKPLDGALVRAYTVGQGATGFFADDPPAAVDRATTNAKGEAVFPRLAAGRWNFVAHTPGYERRATGDLALQAGASELRFRVTLSTGERLDGRVLDPRGEPVVGVRVTALRRTLTADEKTAPLAIHGRSDGEGRFELLGLPAADVVLWTARPGEDLRVAAAVRLPGVSEIDLVIPDGSSLVGQVTDADDVPLPGAHVVIPFQLPLGIWITGEDETDDDGEFQVRFPSGGGVGTAVVELEGYAPLPAVTGHKGAIAEGQTVRQVLKLQRGVTLTGRVTGPDGPLGGVRVQANGPAAHSGRTSREGRFTITGLPAGEYSIETHKWGYLPATASATIVTGERNTLELETTRGPPIRGRVTDQSGAAVEGAEVWVDGIDIGWAAVTDASGRYELEAASPGENVLHAEKAGFTMARLTVSTGTTAVANANFVLHPLYRVRGQVYAAGGRLPAGAYVQIAGHGGGGGKAHPTQLEWLWLGFERLPVNPDGSFDHTVALADNGFVVHAAAPGYAPATSERRALDGSDAYEVRLRLEKGVAATGRVVDADGKALRGVWVTALALNPGGKREEISYPGAWGPPIAATTDAGGQFRIENLAPGTYAIEARTPSGRAPAVVVDVPGGDPVTLRVRR